MRIRFNLSVPQLCNCKTGTNWCFSSVFAGAGYKDFQGGHLACLSPRRVPGRTVAQLRVAYPGVTAVWGRGAEFGQRCGLPRGPQVSLSLLRLPVLICLSLGGLSVFNSIVPHLGISGYYLISFQISALPPCLPGLQLHRQPHPLREGVLLFCPSVRVSFRWLSQHLLLSRHYPVGSLII